MPVSNFLKSQLFRGGSLEKFCTYLTYASNLLLRKPEAGQRTVLRRRRTVRRRGAWSGGAVAPQSCRQHHPLRYHSFTPTKSMSSSLNTDTSPSASHPRPGSDDVTAKLEQLDPGSLWPWKRTNTPHRYRFRTKAGSLPLSFYIGKDIVRSRVILGRGDQETELAGRSARGRSGPIGTEAFNCQLVICILAKVC